ncbi:MAG TPA: prepilin-type N-terminal cleavage/methylation domain-containing protein [Myxococcaceae bacterium]|nr:prepilin-type N-terminal cleavage/methylation domain-containing protein [Myxococcaceae bacterium]
MAARQVTRAARGFTLIELAVTVGICAILVALSASALTSARKVSRVAGQARLILQQLQTVRTNAVGQGAAQGYYFGPNGAGAAGPDANQGFVFYKQDPTATVVNYVVATDRQDPYRDTLPTSGNESLVVVTGAGVVQPAPFQIGFDMNGQVTVTPAPLGFPYCIRISDFTDPAIVRYVILFNDGTSKVQGDETWCP